MHSHINYKIIGTGKPVVFLHGFLESMTMWSDLISKDSPFQSILIDLPGHGNSTLEDTESPSLNYFAKQVITLLKKLEIDQYHVVGHSMGGYVSLILKEKDENCEKVILLNSNFWEDSDDKKRDRIRVADIVLKNKTLFLKEAIPNLYNDRQNFESQIQSLLEEALKMEEMSIAYASIAMSKRTDYSEFIRTRNKEIFMIQGQNDQIVPIELSKEKNTKIEIPLYVVDNVGHMSHFESPKIVKDLLNEILALQL